MIDHSRGLNRFALRARRIAAHSLASDRATLGSLSEFTFTGHIQLDGSMEIRRALPDEEAFESLAARVRPLLVKSESVYYEKVLKAIQTSLHSQEANVPARLLTQFASLQHQWSGIDLGGTTVLRFAIQSAKTDGSEVTPQVSDTQLAAAWLYGDLVHVDTKGHKSKGLLFPIKERYSAAVSYFAHVAVLTLRTLDLVIELHEEGVINLDIEVLERDVVVGVNELVDKSVAYVAPAGSPMPALDITRELPEGFQPLTVTELLRHDPVNQLKVVLTAADGSTVSEYEAAVSRREQKDDRLHWEALVAGAVTIEVSFRLEDGSLKDGRFEGLQSHATTNRLKLAEAMLSLEMATSQEMHFLVEGEKFFSLGVGSRATPEVTFIEVSIDTLYDLVVIENITGRELTPLSGHYSNSDRAMLRRTRLLWEGEVVQFRLSPLESTAPAGTIPRVVVAPATIQSIGDTNYPLPLTCIRHPLMDAQSISSVPDSDPPTDQTQMVVPSGEPFLAWAPEKRQVDGDDDLLQPAPWDLSHFDERPYIGRRQNEHEA